MPDEGQDSAQRSVDIFKVIMLTGAVIGIISVFLLWYAKDYGIFDISYTGYDFFTKSHGHPDEGYFIYMPLVVLLASALALAPFVFSFTAYEKKAAAAAAVIGAVILVAALLYVTYPESQMWLCTPDGGVNWINKIRLMDNPGAGIYCAMAAGLFLIAGGAGVLLRRRNL